MNTKLIINTERDGYSTDQVREPMTVNDLIRLLQEYTPDTEIYLSFDDGYMFGTIRDFNIYEE